MSPTPFSYAVTHVFHPSKLHEYSDYTPENDLSLLRTVCDAARTYGAHIDSTSSERQWSHITKMLDNLQSLVGSKKHAEDDLIISQLCAMQIEDVLTYFIRRQNLAIILTKQESSTLFETFDVSPLEDAVEGTPGPLICSYPGSVIEIPNGVFDDRGFHIKLSKILSGHSVVDPDLPSPLPSSQSTTTLLTDVLQGVVPVTGFPRITKRVRDRVVWNRKEVVWRRSSLWLFIRVSIQMSFDRVSSGHTSYKHFMLFFLCTLAGSPDNAELSGDLLHLMSFKILRRLGKLGSSPPIWLSEMVKRTCTHLREILDVRWKELSSRPSLFRNPTQDELRRDTRITLQNSREYIRNALANRVHDPLDTSFNPTDRRRGTLNDFLSSDGAFFEEAYAAEPDVTLYDVDRSVEQGIDDWLACVTNVEEACSQIEILMDKYITKAGLRQRNSRDPPECQSVTFLTAIELFVALDKLIVKEIPMLVDYSPEIPTAFLDNLRLRDTTSIHRLSCLYQYLSARQSQSCPGWSIVSNEYTQDSFAVRYYDKSPDLQRLKARIEHDAMERKGYVDLKYDAADETTHTHSDYERLSGKELAGNPEFWSSPLPTSPLHAKAVIFELQCPAYIRIWRSAAFRVLFYSSFYPDRLKREPKCNLLAHVPALQPYVISCEDSPVSCQTHVAYSHTVGSHSRHKPTLYFTFQYLDTWTTGGCVPQDPPEDCLVTWEPSVLLGDGKSRLEHLKTRETVDIESYIYYSSHTSNDILSMEVDYLMGLSPQEFILFGHLRSGGSLQWLNMLKDLRSRALNLCHRGVNLLLTHAALQIGPLDLNTGIWLWHQELQDSSFCDLLLDELDSLFVDVGSSSVNGTMMRTISLVLARVLASSPSEGISERAIKLLGDVRKKTFSWVQDLSYELDIAHDRGIHLAKLHYMAASCRSTFNTGVTTLCRTFQIRHSTNSIDALLTCANLIIATRSNGRDIDLSLSLEGFLRNEILSDPSNYSIDLAIGRLFPSHKPSAHRWEKMQHPNASWITCRAREIDDQSSQTLHLDLRYGIFRVGSKPLCGLPRECIEDSSREFPNPSYLPQIFRDQGFFPVPSSLPGMDFMARATKSNYKLHFSLRGNDLVVQAQCDETNEILQLVPLEKIEKDLPIALTHPYAHWLNLSTRMIEIRPLTRLWEQSSENWMIDCSTEPYRIYRGHQTLVDIRSPTWMLLSKCFKCLNYIDPDDLVVTVSPTNPESIHLSVVLPCYNLSFFVNGKGELESCDFKNMVYDEDQSIGTLFGLENLLVLRQESHLAPGLIPRHVLIPSGYPPKKHDNDWIKIYPTYPENSGLLPRFYTARSLVNDPSMLFIPDRSKPYYHTYKVDTELGCLVADNSMSMLYIANLHAKTSRDRPDPLIGKSGVQAALCLLGSAGCRSIIHKATIGDYYSRQVLGWTPTDIPEVELALDEILRRHSWGRYGCGARDTGRDSAKRQATYPSPLDLTGSLSSEEHERVDQHSISLERRYMSWWNSLPQITRTFDQLLSARSAPELPSRSNFQRCSYQVLPPQATNISDLGRLLSSLEHISEAVDSESFKRQYISSLNASAQCIHMESQPNKQLLEKNRIEGLTEHYLQCRDIYIGALDTLKRCLGPGNPYDSERELDQFVQWYWPPVTANILLRYLASTSPIYLPIAWKECLISLALLLLDVQRARRLLRLAMGGLEDEFLKELENEGCDEKRYRDHPDWLLIQIQGNFLIRPTQVDTAMKIMDPGSGQNSVMQVNMGEGKSSVIIPLAASALADGKQLVRVIVPKALTAQMLELLVSRLGMLANRPIYHLPFSRSVVYDSGGEIRSLQIEDLRRLMSQCVVDRGILLVQPEHVVSLKLMAVEQQTKLDSNLIPESAKSAYNHIITAMSFKQLPHDYLQNVIVQPLDKWLGHLSNGYMNRADRFNKDNEDVSGRLDNGSGSGTAEGNNATGAGGEDVHVAPNKAAEWLGLQKWIHAYARDILDESDEILHARFQLIYTIGLEHHVDGYPNRWMITQKLLRLTKKHAYSLSKCYPNSIQCVCGLPGSFPQLHIVRGSEGGRYLIGSIVEDVMGGRLPGFNFQHLPPDLCDAVRSFISEEDIISSTSQLVEEYAKGPHQSHMWSGLLLLRGLLACNVLLFSLSERRWRVDYGLVTDRDSPDSTMLAVPYRAKDVPAPDTQFGHPDITIILTCLSYYYTGFDRWGLRNSFETLLNEDDPVTEYSSWVEECDPQSVPDSLRELGEVNLHSSEQWNEIVFPLFSQNQATVDFYLSRVVFPKEAKEFPWKISGSSWDLAEKREKLVTGFSGTNDSRWLLPMSIAQRDLDHQKGSNARVLGYLLGAENNSYMVTHESGKPWTTRGFLQMVAKQRPEIRVLLDVGAQALDLSNLQVVTAWLKIAPCDTAGAIYFNEKDELMVLTKSGTKQSMTLSPLSGQLGRCVVYLDHAHTRGTDIKIPIGARAAVTLGPKVTKDSLVQGCMRMRKLGHGHSVMFFAPPEIDADIREVSKKQDSDAQITIVDILCWAIRETWIDIKKRAPYWAQQGMNHRSRYDVWKRFCNNELGTKQLSDVWRQPDYKFLTELYAPSCGTTGVSNALSDHLDPAIRQRCRDLGVLSLRDARMEEEQEREVNREREREREVERPPKAKAAKHHLHPDVVTFVNTGYIPPLTKGGAFLPIFATLEKSSAGVEEADVWSQSILATADFCRTVIPESTEGTMDQYLRPVQWILSHTKANHGTPLLVIISPFETDRLMPAIRKSEHVHLHLYAPRTSKRMKPCDNLEFYTIPPLPSDWTPPWDLIDQLNIFAGQLYLRDYQSYFRVCRFLGVPMEQVQDNTRLPWNSLRIPGGLEEDEIRFTNSPIPFVMTLLAIRTRGRPFDHTHMGKIIQGQKLTADDFREVRRSSTNLAAGNTRTQHEGTRDIVPPSPSDMDCDVPEDSTIGWSTSILTSKRKAEINEKSDADPPKKRLRLDGQQ